MNTLSRICVILVLLLLNPSFGPVAYAQADTQQITVMVQGGDSLLDIAFENRFDDPSVSIQQTMLAIQQLNPDAFIGGNINRIMAGKRLLMPALDQVRAINQANAIQQIRIQNQSFIEYSSGRTSESSQLGQLSVLRPGMVSSRNIPGLEPLERQNTELDQRVTELEVLLALALEEEDRYRLSREDLSAQLAELDAQIEAAKEIIRIQDLQLSQLRADLANTQLESADRAIPLSEAGMPEEKVAESESYPLMERFAGFFGSNSPLVTIAAPLALLLLGWLLWWDRKNYASANSQASSPEEALAGEMPEISSLGSQSESALDVQVDAEDNAVYGVANFDNDTSTNQSNIERVGADGSSNEENEKLDFSVGEEQKDFEDLAFLSEEDRVELDSPGDIEEVFLLGSEESATKLELAYAYQKMGDLEGAKEILAEVILEGSSEQKMEAEKLLTAIGNASE